jgi:predicted dehydrogenase/threonine dehydrogenase-like Zn-dependent dehydrogenase
VKQVVLDPRSGRVSLVETPAPQLSANRLLVRTDVSAISAGTERMLIGLSSKSLPGKARARPDAARQAFDAVRREGPRSALWKAMAQLDHPYSLGYSLAGTVLEVGGRLAGPRPGTRVACAGPEIATHSEIVLVPPLLAVPVPEEVSQEEAAFASIGAIAMHAVRLAGVEPGGTAAVLGLGLVGQLALQILVATGAWAMGVDPVESRRTVAASLAAAQVSAGGRDAVTACQDRGGADAVLVAVAGGGPEVLTSAVEMARDRGRLVVVGTVPISLDRDSMYRKELSLVVARSSGPGKYDPNYEQEGIDLPVGHVRWTEGRNMAAFLELIRQRRLFIRGLITHRFPIEEAERAYELLERGAEEFLGIVLSYDPSTETAQKVVSLDRATVPGGARPRIGVVGAGSFARGVLLPRLKRLPVTLTAIATATGQSATRSAQKFGFTRATTDPESVITGVDVDAIVIATRHDLHAGLTAEALRAGRSVYVEKPLALDRESLLEVCRAWAESKGTLSVGFNRRYAPSAAKLGAALAAKGIVTASYVVNVAPISLDSWILHPQQGGGVALAEGGHFIDTLTFLVGCLPVLVSASPVDRTSYQATIRFEDGSVGTIMYTTGGLGHGPKERITVAGRGVFAGLDDYRSLSVWSGRSCLL